MYEIAVEPPCVLVGKKLLGQLERLGDLQRGETKVGMAHRLVVHPLVQVALQHEKLPQVVTTPTGPIVRCKQHLGICPEQQQTLVDVLRPVQRVAYQRTADRHQVVHRVRTILRHAQCSQVGEVEVHLRWCFRFGCQLEDHPHSVHHELLAGCRDLLGRGKQSGRTQGHCGAKTTVHVPARPRRQQRSELIGGTARHGWTGNHVFADGLTQEVFGCDDSTLARINLLA